VLNYRYTLIIFNEISKVIAINAIKNLKDSKEKGEATFKARLENKKLSP
jgi:hypothetical protein